MGAVACGPKVGLPEGNGDAAADDGVGSTTGVAGETGGGEGHSDPTTGVSTSGAATIGSDDGLADSSSDGEHFLVAPDGGVCSGLPPGYLGHCTWECDLWQQDCMRGEKCVPWASSGPNAWNAVRCSEVAADPATVGQSCQVEGAPTSGLDDCDLGLVCMFVDPATNVGTCVAQCTGNVAEPTCPASTQCVISGDGVLTLCLEACDPFAEPCDTAAACVPADQGFVCLPNVPSPVGNGAECDNAEDCAPGLACVGSDQVDCEGDRCCTVLCDLSAPDPNAACPDADSGEVCAPVYTDPVPAGYESAGICVSG